MLDIHIHPAFGCFNDPWLETLELDIEGNWSEQEESFQCLKNHLRAVRIYGYVTNPCVLQLVQFLLKNAMVLEKMVIISKRISDSDRKSYFAPNQLLELSQKLPSFPRASTSAVILFS